MIEPGRSAGQTEKGSFGGWRHCESPSGPRLWVSLSHPGCHTQGFASEVLAFLSLCRTPRLLTGFSSRDDFIYYTCPQFQIYFPPHQKYIILGNWVVRKILPPCYYTAPTSFEQNHFLDIYTYFCLGLWLRESTWEKSGEPTSPAAGRTGPPHCDPPQTGAVCLFWVLQTHRPALCCSSWPLSYWSENLFSKGYKCLQQTPPSPWPHCPFGLHPTILASYPKEVRLSLSFSRGKKTQPSNWYLSPDSSPPPISE